MLLKKIILYSPKLHLFDINTVGIVKYYYNLKYLMFEYFKENYERHHKNNPSTISGSI